MENAIGIKTFEDAPKERRYSHNRYQYKTPEGTWVTLGPGRWCGKKAGNSIHYCTCPRCREVVHKEEYKRKVKTNRYAAAEKIIIAVEDFIRLDGYTGAQTCRFCASPREYGHHLSCSLLPVQRAIATYRAGKL